MLLWIILQGASWFKSSKSMCEAGSCLLDSYRGMLGGPGAGERHQPGTNRSWSTKARVVEKMWVGLIVLTQRLNTLYGFWYVPNNQQSINPTKYKKCLVLPYTNGCYIPNNEQSRQLTMRDVWLWLTEYDRRFSFMRHLGIDLTQVKCFNRFQNKQTNKQLTLDFSLAESPYLPLMLLYIWSLKSSFWGCHSTIIDDSQTK